MESALEPHTKTPQWSQYTAQHSTQSRLRGTVGSEGLGVLHYYTSTPLHYYITTLQLPTTPPTPTLCTGAMPRLAWCGCAWLWLALDS